MANHIHIALGRRVVSRCAIRNVLDAFLFLCVVCGIWCRWRRILKLLLCALVATSGACSHCCCHVLCCGRLCCGCVASETGDGTIKSAVRYVLGENSGRYHVRVAGRMAQPWQVPGMQTGVRRPAQASGCRSAVRSRIGTATCERPVEDTRLEKHHLLGCCVFAMLAAQAVVRTVVNETTAARVRVMRGMRGSTSLHAVRGKRGRATRCVCAQSRAVALWPPSTGRARWLRIQNVLAHIACCLIKF